MPQLMVSHVRHVRQVRKTRNNPWITAANVKYAFDNTANGSLLRKSVRNLVVSDEPLSRRAILEQKDLETMRSNGRGCLVRAEILCWMSLWRVLFE